MSTRYFVAKTVRGQFSGRYTGTPVQAARKAFSSLRGNRNEMTVVVKETTRGSNRKEYKYRIRRTRLENPEPVHFHKRNSDDKRRSKKPLATAAFKYKISAKSMNTSRS